MGLEKIFHKMIEENRWYKHCVNCEHFDNGPDICLLANQRPPAKVIVSGCDKWVDDIPF